MTAHHDLLTHRGRSFALQVSGRLNPSIQDAVPELQGALPLERPMSESRGAEPLCSERLNRLPSAAISPSVPCTSAVHWRWQHFHPGPP